MIELLILDVDGTLTDGSIIHTNDGDELKAFDVKDGLAVASWTKKLGKKVAIITGRTSKVVEKRAAELQVSHLFQGIDNKDAVIETILEEENLKWENIAAIGDDLNDYKMLKRAGLSFCPNDAVQDIQSIVNVVCGNKGGRGAVREMVEYVLTYNDEKSLKELWV
jgi:3-deoxy-D-manno-octulosonate 8-phosphate phosphatase (KDO 8-P phosphatase)